MSRIVIHREELYNKQVSSVHFQHSDFGVGLEVDDDDEEVEDAGVWEGLVPLVKTWMGRRKPLAAWWGMAISSHVEKPTQESKWSLKRSGYSCMAA